MSSDQIRPIVGLYKLEVLSAKLNKGANSAVEMSDFYCITISAEAIDNQSKLVLVIDK